MLDHTKGTGALGSMSEGLESSELDENSYVVLMVGFAVQRVFENGRAVHIENPFFWKDTPPSPFNWRNLIDCNPLIAGGWINEGRGHVSGSKSMRVNMPNGQVEMVAQCGTMYILNTHVKF